MGACQSAGARPASNQVAPLPLSPERAAEREWDDAVNAAARSTSSPSVVVILLDLDNWADFLQRLPFALPACVRVVAAMNAAHPWRAQGGPKVMSSHAQVLWEAGRLLPLRSAVTKDAADALLADKAARLDGTLPSCVAFVLLSGDAIFLETQRNMQTRGRTVFLCRAGKYDELSTVLNGIVGTQLVGDKVSPRKPRRRWNKKKGRASGGSGDSGGAESEAQDGARGGDGEARRKDRNARRKKLPRLKTRMCRHIDAPDGCPFGQACRFAHSSAELREPPVQTSAAQASNEKGGSKERQGNGVEMLKIHT